MKKTIIISAISIFTALIILVTYFNFFYDIKTNLTGNIVFKNMDGNITVCSLSENQYTSITQNNKNLGYFDSIEFNPEKTHIITIVKHNTFIPNSIYEFDLKTGEETKIFDKTNIYTEMYNVKYVPKSNKISFLLDHDIVLLDIDTKEMTKLVKAYDESISRKIFYYSWNEDGTLLYYMDSENSISTYNVKNKEIKKFIDGSRPILSYDGKYIAYDNPSGELIVMDMITKKIKSYGRFDYYDKCFSPDNKQIAIGQSWWFFVGVLANIRIVDLSSGRHHKAFKDNECGNIFNWR